MTLSLSHQGPPSAPVPRVVPLRTHAVPDAVVTAPPRTPAPATTPALRTTPDTLEALAREHLPGLLRYATILTGDEHTAADLVQEVLLRAHVRWHRIALTERPELYLRRMVTNEHLSWRRRWHVRTIRPAADDELVARSTPHADHAQSLAEEDAMWQRLAALPPRQRAVLVLRYYEDLSDVEIAAVLDTSAATVRSHASRALAALRRTDLPSTETR